MSDGPAFLIALCVEVAVIAGNVAAVLGITASTKITAAGQIALYAALLLADVCAQWVIFEALTEGG